MEVWMAATKAAMWVAYLEMQKDVELVERMADLLDFLLVVL
jgi:hypothetical protein